MTQRLQITDYEDKLALLAQENQRLTERVAQYSLQAETTNAQADSKDKRIRQLMRDNDTIATRERRAREEADSLRERLRTAGEWQAEREGLQLRTRQLRDELEAVQLQLSGRETEWQRLQAKYQAASLELHALQVRAELPASPPRQHPQQQEDPQLELLVQQRGRDAARVAQLEREVREGEEAVEALSAEVERLNAALGKRMEEVGGYRREIDFLQHKVRTCEEALLNRRNAQPSSEQTIADTENRSKMEFAEGRLRSYEGEMEVLRQRCAVLRENTAALEARVSALLAEKALLQQRLTDQDFQLRERQDHLRMA